jgi:hypothetical protein
MGLFLNSDIILYNFRPTKIDVPDQAIKMKFSEKICCIPLVVLMLALTTTARSDTLDLKILGWVENTHLPGPDLGLKAKLDTGAETSSLDARILKKFRKGGKRWVRFALLNRETGEETLMVRERIRTIGVVQHDGGRQTRPVVMLEVCIASQLFATEVSLIDRSEFNYPLLLGRSALASFALVDAGNTFLSRPDCASPGNGASAP